MKKTAIIVAAGSGSRMGTSLPKQFVTLCGRPLIFYTLQAFLDAYEDLNIILVTHPDYFDPARQAITLLSRPFALTLVAGGATRYDSVRAGLEHADDDSIVFVHDGARCLVSPDLIRRCYTAAVAHGNAVPAIKAVDSLRLVQKDGNQPLDREQVRIVQTPQTFRTPDLRRAYAACPAGDFTDDASVAEQAGIVIHLVEGEPSNLKVTYPLDLLVAEKIIEQNRQA